MARWILHSSIMRLLRCAGIWLPTQAGRRCLDASSRRYKRVLRRGPGRDLEESFKFQVSSFDFPFSIFYFREVRASRRRREGQGQARRERWDDDGRVVASKRSATLRGGLRHRWTSRDCRRSWRWAEKCPARHRIVLRGG